MKALINLVSDRPSTKTSKSGLHILKRPIICVCNDAYVPALRPLRKIAQMYNIRNPPVTDIVKRLRNICKMEDIKTDNRTLTLLVEKADCDIRSCLNTLQILKTRLLRQHRFELYANKKARNEQPQKNIKYQPTITVEMIKNSSAGSKDFQKSVFSVWRSIFFSGIGYYLQASRYSNIRKPRKHNE